MNLAEVIQNEMNNDDECSEKVTIQLLDLYERATPSEKSIINELVISLTGWSFDSLLEKAR